MYWMPQLISKLGIEHICCTQCPKYHKYMATSTTVELYAASMISSLIFQLLNNATENDFGVIVPQFDMSLGPISHCLVPEWFRLPSYLNQTTGCPLVAVKSNSYIFSSILDEITESFLLWNVHMVRLDLVCNTCWKLCKWAQDSERHFRQVK